MEGREAVDALARSGRPFLFAIWHGRLGLAALWKPEGRRAVALISNNRDGDLIAALIARFGGEAVRGSSADPRKPGKDKGGRAAFQAGLDALRAGGVLVITPDGPRGPRMRARDGVAALSALSGAPVVPVAISTARGRVLGSWDRFLLPLPFDRACLLYGEPLAAPAADAPQAVEAHRARVEAALNALTAEADRRMGRAPVAPEPAASGTGPAPLVT